jgi:phage recombination protein Bet
MALELIQRDAVAVSVSGDQLELVKRTVAAGATDAELKLYLYDCQRHGVHPLDKLLHFTKRGGKYVPITSIDLMRIRAASTGECAGITDAVFSGEGKDLAATVTVKRAVAGVIAEFTATARWSEYCPDSGSMWKKMPHTMLGKCAEALALRKGFPQQLSGLYAKEEMEQAERPERVVSIEPVPEAPPAPEGFEDWWADMEATADEGIDKLSTAFAHSKLEFKAHMHRTIRSQWEALKVKAEAVRVAR